MCGLFFAQTRLALLLNLGVALAAVDGTVGLGNEGHAGGLATLGAYRFEHLTLAVGVVARGLAGVAAFLAAGRLVLEALLGVESLFTGREHEFLAAVFAYKSLVFVHWKITPKKNYEPCLLADLVFDPTLAGWSVRS